MRRSEIVERFRRLVEGLAPDEAGANALFPVDPHVPVLLICEWERSSFLEVVELATELVNRAESIGWDRDLHVAVGVERYRARAWRVALDATWYVAPSVADELVGDIERMLISART